MEIKLEMSEFSSGKLRVTRKQEFELSDTDRSSLGKILKECFPDYLSERIFYKQIPTMRLMAYYQEQLVGQLGIDHRVVAIDKQPHQIFGVVDLCVIPSFRNKDIATLLMTTLESLALKYNIEHLIAFADDHNFYERLDYKQINTKCRFLAIEDLSSHSVIERNEKEVLLIRSFKDIDLTGKIIDLLGHLL